MIFRSIPENWHRLAKCIDKNHHHQCYYFYFYFIADEAIDKDIKYLVPRTYGKYLEKANYVKYAENDNFYFNLTLNRQPKFPRKDIVIDLPPKRGSLKVRQHVVIPVEYVGGKGKKKDKCGPSKHDRYLNGTLLNAAMSEVGVKSAYVRKYIKFVVQNRGSHLIDLHQYHEK